MFDKINNLFENSKNFLNLAAYQQKIISSNIANSDTPNYHPLNIDLKKEINTILDNKIRKQQQISLLKTSTKHFSSNRKNKVAFNIFSKHYEKLNFKKNNLDINQERIKFIKNALQYQSQINFLTFEIKNITNTILGQ
ncbi:flagellar basal body rod protein FlgB [Buchnera aphidicola]|uniref:flagellar basal body rod protein FlgB n=1 Tax=Buchnera aphidicola TaxID=9 RepID=UPI003463C0B6